MGIGVPFPGTTRPGRRVDHSRLFSAEARNEWGYTSTPSTCLHGVHTDSFTFMTYNQLRQVILNNSFFLFLKGKKKKVKFIQEQAMKAQMGSRGVALLFL
jgi:hypothetical protein